MCLLAAGRGAAAAWRWSLLFVLKKPQLTDSSATISAGRKMQQPEVYVLVKDRQLMTSNEESFFN